MDLLNNSGIRTINIEILRRQNTQKRRQAGAELGQAQPQLGLRLANVEI